MENNRAIALSCLDLTSLNDADMDTDIMRLCEKAVFGNVAAVCVWPEFVTLAKRQLRGSEVQVATVIAFPDGVSSAAEIAAETQAAVADGADELDLVLDYRAFLRGEFDTVAAKMAACRAACPGKIFKVILESGAFTDMVGLESACRMAVATGADFLKTSTGKIAQGATLEAAAVLCKVAAEAGIGVKISGGVRTDAQAFEYMKLAREYGIAVAPKRFRFGASGLYDALTGNPSPGKNGNNNTMNPY